MRKRPIKLALTCTPGGHYEQMLNLSDFYGAYRHFWITSRTTQTKHAAGPGAVYFISMAHFKKPWTYLIQFPQVLRILLKERPTHIVSTGSGRIVFVPYLLSVPFRIPFIHVDTFSHVHGFTKMAKFMARTKSPILTQWESPTKDRAIYIGPVFKDDPVPAPRRSVEPYVFVTAGTREEPFPRMFEAVEALMRDGLIGERVTAQAGTTRRASSRMETFAFRPSREIDDLILNARYVITQESAGIVTKCLKYRTRFIVMPRDYAHGELPAKSDMNEDLHIRLAELGYTYVVHDAEEMRRAIERLDDLKVGFAFDNSRAVATLRRLVGD
jgi:UDP-N-acetylglucosamine transferase subunit ALG13